MRALTIRQPWADAIAHGTKRVENRSRPVPPALAGTRIAIHAGAARDRHALPAAATADWPDTRSAIIATATLTDSHPDANCCRPWGFADQHHWRLADVLLLPEPLPARGQLGLWRPTPQLLLALTATAPTA